MYTVNVSWIGGPNWDNDAPSMFNPNKKKSATEHLIETGGQSIDEAIESFDKFRDYPIKVEQFKKPGTNWVTSLQVTEEDDQKALEIVEELVTKYTNKKQQLLSDPSGYAIEIEVITQ
jgi:hypothetical protein